MMRRPLLLIAVVSSALTGCVALPHADAQDAQRAQGRYPGATVTSLERGRQAYVNNCSGCHMLYLPESRSPSDWPGIVAEMGEEGGIGDEDLAIIEQFLITMAERPKDTGSGGR